MSLQPRRTTVTRHIAFDGQGHAIHHVGIPCTYKAEPAEAEICVWIKDGKIVDLGLAVDKPVWMWTALHRAQARWHIGQWLKTQRLEALRALSHVR